VSTTKDGPGARPATRPLSSLAGRGRSSALEECPGTSLVKEPIRATRSMERKVRFPKCARNPRNGCTAPRSTRSAPRGEQLAPRSSHPFRGRHSLFHEMGRIFSGTVHPLRGTNDLFAKQVTSVIRHGRGHEFVNGLLTMEPSTSIYWSQAGRPDSLLSGQTPGAGSAETCSLTTESTRS